MAVFFTNVCKFSDCGLTFPSLRQLIEHIEDSHIGECSVSLLTEYVTQALSDRMQALIHLFRPRSLILALLLLA